MPDTKERNYPMLRAKYAQFCADNGCAPYPMIGCSVKSLLDCYKTYVAFLESGAVLPSYTRQASGAIGGVFRANGFPFDASFSIISKAVKANLNRARTKRQLMPLFEADMRDFISSLDEGRPNDDRDAILFLLCWSFRIRCVDLVGLTYHPPSLIHEEECSGWVRVTRESGIEMKLRPMRTRTGIKEDFRSPAVDLSLAMQLQTALGVWVNRAELKPGDFLFRPVNNKHEVWGGQLTERSFRRRIHTRMLKVALLRGMKPKEAKEWSRQFSGRSMVNRPSDGRIAA